MSKRKRKPVVPLPIVEEEDGEWILVVAEPRRDGGRGDLHESTVRNGVQDEVQPRGSMHRCKGP